MKLTVTFGAIVLSVFGGRTLANPALKVKRQDSGNNFSGDNSGGNNLSGDNSGGTSFSGDNSGGNNFSGDNSCDDGRAQCQAKCGDKFTFFCHCEGRQSCNPNCQCVDEGAAEGVILEGPIEQNPAFCQDKRRQCRRNCGDAMSYSCNCVNGMCSDFCDC